MYINKMLHLFFFFFFFLVCVFCLSMVAYAVYGGSQASGLIRALAAGHTTATATQDLSHIYNLYQQLVVTPDP